MKVGWEQMWKQTMNEERDAEHEQRETSIRCGFFRTKMNLFESRSRDKYNKATLFLVSL